MIKNDKYVDRQTDRQNLFNLLVWDSFELSLADHGKLIDWI